MIGCPIYPNRLVAILVDEDVGVSDIEVIYALLMGPRKRVISRKKLGGIARSVYRCWVVERQLTRRLYS